MQIFSWLGRPLSLDFANTVWPGRRRGPVDTIASTTDLRVWLDRAAVPASASDFDDRLADLRGLRAAVRQLLEARARGDVLPRRAMEVVNLFATEAPRVHQLVADARGPRIVEDVLSEDPASLFFGRVALSTMDVMTTMKVGICRSPGCGLFFIESREAQRWCNNTCGNRARVARHAAKA